MHVFGRTQNTLNHTFVHDGIMTTDLLTFHLSWAELNYTWKYSSRNYTEYFSLNCKGCALPHMVIKQTVSLRLTSERKQEGRIKTTRGCWGRGEKCLVCNSSWLRRAARIVQPMWSNLFCGKPKKVACDRPVSRQTARGCALCSSCSSPNISPRAQATRTGDDEITSPIVPFFTPSSRNIKTRASTPPCASTAKEREKKGHFPWGQTSFRAYFAFGPSCGRSWAALMWQLRLRSAVETQDNNICLESPRKERGLPMPARCRGVVPELGGVLCWSQLWWCLQLEAGPPCVHLLCNGSCGFSVWTWETLGDSSH